nr:unnamed protein product [Digitaria exilis]
MEGIIPLVSGAIKRRRRAKKAVDYELLSSAGAPAPTWGHQERSTGAAYHSRSQSCRFPARSPDDELCSSRDEGDRALPEGLRDEPFTPAGGDGLRGLSSRSWRFSSMRLFGCE